MYFSKSSLSLYCLSFSMMGVDTCLCALPRSADQVSARCKDQESLRAVSCVSVPRGLQRSGNKLPGQTPGENTFHFHGFKCRGWGSSGCRSSNFCSFSYYPQEPRTSAGPPLNSVAGGATLHPRVYVPLHMLNVLQNQCVFIVSCPSHW